MSLAITTKSVDVRLIVHRLHTRGLAATLGGCKAPADLAGLPVYDEGFQRTYFEAQNHLAKGDLDLLHVLLGA